MVKAMVVIMVVDIVARLKRYYWRNNINLKETLLPIGERVSFKFM